MLKTRPPETQCSLGLLFNLFSAAVGEIDGVSAIEETNGVSAVEEINGVLAAEEINGVLKGVLNVDGVPTAAEPTEGE